MLSRDLSMNESESKSDVGQPANSLSADAARCDLCCTIDNVPGCVLIADTEGQIIYANKVALTSLGRPLEDVLGDGWLKYLDPHIADEAKETWQQCVLRREPLDVIWRLRRHDDTYRLNYVKAEPKRDDKSQDITWYILGIDVEDVTVLRTLEVMSLQSNQQMQRMMDSVPSMLWSVAPGGGVTLINRNVREYTGMSLEQIQELGWLEIIHPDERDLVASLCQEALSAGKHYEAEHRLRRADGKYRWHLRRAVPLTSEDGQVVQWFAIDIDIDDHKRAEERIQELRTNVSDLSKSSMGAEISASIAHEINQPLTSVLINAQACARWLSVAPPRLEEAVMSVERVVRDARAVDAVMRNLRLLFKRQLPVKSSCNMVQLVRDAVSLIEGSSRRLTQIRYEFEELQLMVLVDRYQIQQVIVNLVANAIEAMQGIDRLPLLRIRSRHATDRQIITEFIDNGCGLPLDNPEGIFEAFITTKESGMGIGLSISRSIVDSHGGRLWGNNNVDYGATFSLLIEASEPMSAGN